MNRTEVFPSQGNVVHQLISKFIVPAPGHSPEKIKSRILHWMRQANSPALFAPPSASASDLAKLRHKARQNVKRLAEVHPEIAAEILAAVKPEDVR